MFRRMVEGYIECRKVLCATPIKTLYYTTLHCIELYTPCLAHYCKRYFNELMTIALTDSTTLKIEKY